MSTFKLTKDTFDEVVSANDFVIIDFWAEWCGPCRAFGPVFEQVSDKHQGIVFAKVDTEAEPELARAFEITSIPTLMIVRERITVFRQAGAPARGGARRPRHPGPRPRHGRRTRLRHRSTRQPVDTRGHQAPRGRPVPRHARCGGRAARSIRPSPPPPAPPHAGGGEEGAQGDR